MQEQSWLLEELPGGGSPLFGVPSLLKDLKSEVFSLGHSIFPEESANFLTGDEIWPLGIWAQDGESGLVLTMST